MDLKNLKTFVCVANCLNYSKAAEALNFSQPTVSTQIQALEEELGQKLFVHVGKKTYLTPQGMILKKDAEQLLAMADEIETKFKSMANENKLVKVAAHEVFCCLYLPVFISRYLREHEKVDMELHSNCTNDVIAGIKENKYDVGIISGVVEQTGIRSIPVDDTRVEVIVSAALAQKYTLEEIVEKYPYIRYQADAMQYSMDLSQTLQQSGIIPRRTMRFESIFAITKAVRDGLGYSVLSVDNVTEEIRAGEICTVTPPGVNVLSRTSAICLEDNAERPEIKEFIQEFTK